MNQGIALFALLAGGAGLLSAPAAAATGIAEKPSAAAPVKLSTMAQESTASSQPANALVDGAKGQQKPAAKPKTSSKSKPIDIGCTTTE